jgi:phosphotransferase system enzyme I (PtsI)
VIRLRAKSFGYGRQVAKTHVVREDCPLTATTELNGVALTFATLPSVRVFEEYATQPGIACCIIPLCSSYSHLAAAIWSAGVATLALEEPYTFVSGAYVLADFESGALLLAESESEINELQATASNLETRADNRLASSFQRSEHTRPDIAVLVEAASPSDIPAALAAGCDGLSVIRAEDLCRVVNGRSCVDTRMIEVLTANPQLFPVPVRFFDPEENAIGRDPHLPVPQGYLGYRGVRILEVDDTWYDRFISSISALDAQNTIVVLPMVTSIREVLQMQQRLSPMWKRIGVTVETPAAAVRIHELLEVAEFIQIGLNDLTQYTMAWDRDVPNEERLPTNRIAEPVAELIASVACACTAAGVPHTLGLDLRPTVELAAQINQLGVNSISCALSLIHPWKTVIAEHSFGGR